MRNLISLFAILLIGFFVISCCEQSSAQQNLKGWYCKNLKMNAIGTHGNVPNVNKAGAGIWGTDTTINLPVANDNFTIGWWAIACTSTRVGTGTTSFISLKGSFDNINYFNLPGDSIKLSTSSYTQDKITNARTIPFYLWSITNSGYTVFKGYGWPYPTASLYISKGNDSTTISCPYYFERIANK